LTTLNFASGRAVSMQEVLDLLGDLRKRPLSIMTDPGNTDPE